jgi:hypothetical protein
MTDYGLLYAASRERVSALVRDLDEQRAGSTVAACPSWSVHDVVAHLAGTVTDVLAGRLEGVGSDAWTARQVEARRGVPIRDLVDEWGGGSPQFEDGLRAIGPPLASVAISDQFQHEQDIRGALDEQGGRDHDVLLVTIDAYLPGLAIRIGEASRAAHERRSTPLRGRRGDTGRNGHGRAVRARAPARWPAHARRDTRAELGG